MKYLRIIIRIITGLVFIFSGTVKAIDPSGSAYKFGDYFNAFDLGFLQPLALPLAILLCTAEFFAGVSLLTGFRQKTGIWLTVLLMGLFTPLTLVLAISNPVSDCGCFGDAIHLTNWQTFGKNVVLLAFVLILFSGRKHIKPVSGQATEWVAMSFITLLFVAFSLANLRYLPLIDFLPYRVGTNIPESMKIPEGKPVDEYKTTFIYEKDGIKKEFTLDNYPAGDSTWKFVDQKSVLIKKGYVPPVHDFSITSPGGEDITGKILDNSGYTLLMISVKLEKAAKQKLEEGFALRGALAPAGIDFYVISSSGADETGVYKNTTDICSADETTLKTIVRSNPGYLLIKGGVVEGKWSWADLPVKQLAGIGQGGVQEKNLNNKSTGLIVSTVVLFATLLLLIIVSLTAKNTAKPEKTEI